ncbi:MAG: fibronectin type III domain-containing protein, partial [Trichlorobacter sp.]|uniref:fibronectin type III domain-containing protein n=1 Tax=Trichlorobacter sp. TaxID=2911007 RepID=UPI00255EFB1E
WGSKGDGNGQFSFSGGIAVDSSGKVYVADIYNNRIQRFAPVLVPGAPTIGTATAGNGQATVSFTAPANDGGNAITAYTVTSAPGNITASGAVSPITVTGLTNGTIYTFTVKATNAAGSGPASIASNSVTPLQPMATLTVSIGGNGSVNSDPAGISCTTGAAAGCSASFAQNSSVQLTAMPDRLSLLDHWLGCSPTMETVCTATADATKTISVSFFTAPKARVGSSNYGSFDDAYDGANGGAVIKLIEDVLSFSRSINKPLTLQGGYVAGFGGRSGYTTLEGTPLIISSGSLLLEQIIIK